MKSHHLALSRLSKEHKDLQKKPNPNFFAHPSSSSIFLWDFLIHSLDLPYKEGFYRGQIIFPLEYPTKPPNIIFLTPNGRFKVFFTYTPPPVSFPIKLPSWFDFFMFFLLFFYRNQIYLIFFYSQLNEKICLSFTGFHPESWSTAWNVQTMLTGLIRRYHNIRLRKK